MQTKNLKNTNRVMDPMLGLKKNEKKKASKLRDDHNDDDDDEWEWSPLR